MKRIVAMGGSNSRQSINKTLATYVAGKVENSEVVVADLNDYDLPMYGIDWETEKGFPEGAKQLGELFESADALVVSLAEHNGSYAAAFKSAADWMSRIDRNVWKNKPMLLMATSPGGRGGASVLETAISGFPRQGANVIATFSLPSFHENFVNGEISNEEIKADLDKKVKLFQEAIK